MNPAWIPAQPGMTIDEIDTPALILDFECFKRNLAGVAIGARSQHVRLRPHAKSHKCVEIARHQVQAGAVGICCQKVSEAEVFLAGGITDVLIANEVVGEHKLRRLVAVARHYPQARLGVCVDHPASVRRLGTLCGEMDARLDMYVEIDVGQNRCGVAGAAEALSLAQTIMVQPRLSFMGLQAYFGSAQHRRAVADRKHAVQSASQKVYEVRAALRGHDLPCEIITGGGTGTFAYDAASGVYNEVQPGSYVLMDGDYAMNEVDPNVPRFEHALLLLSTVMSVRGDRAVLDAGLKAFSTDSGPPLPAFPGWQVKNVSDEHTVLTRTGPGADIKLGDKALLVPSHCDPTVNLHDWIVVVEGGRVHAVWPVDARGAVF